MVTTVHADTNGPTPTIRTFDKPELAKCHGCGRNGVMRENGIPAGWRRGHQDHLLCAVCWGPDPLPKFDPLAERKMIPSVWADKPRDPVLEELLRVHSEGFGNGGPVARH